MSDGLEGQPVDGSKKPAGLADDEYEPPVRPRRAGLRVIAVLVIASFFVSIALGATPILDELHLPYFRANPCCICYYPGNTDRIARTWELSRGGNEVEALEEAEAIALDPKASKEERCTAEAQVAESAWQLGENDVALDAIAAFRKQSLGLNIDPKVCDQAKNTANLLDQKIDAKDINPISGVNWSGAKKSLQNPAFETGIAGWWLDKRGGKYAVVTEPNGYGPGKPSASLCSNNASDRDWNMLGQGVAGDNYLGKREELTAWIKADRVRMSAVLYMRIDTPSVVFSASAPHPFLTGTTPWQPQSIVLDVPPDAQGISLGIVLVGSGKVSLANVNLKAVGRDVPTTPARSKF